MTDQPGAWRQMLAARPVRNVAARVEEPAPDCVSVVVRRQRPRYLVPPLSWLLRPRLTARYDLDRLGTEVWRLCDGERTVEEVVDGFAKQHRLSFHESRVAVTGYLRLLVQRGAVAMMLEPPTK